MAGIHTVGMRLDVIEEKNCECVEDTVARVMYCDGTKRNDEGTDQ